MEINPVTQKYYEDYQIYLTRMKVKDLYESRIDHERHIERLKVENTQRARELDKNLGQNIDITV